MFLFLQIMICISVVIWITYLCGKIDYLDNENKNLEHQNARYKMLVDEYERELGIHSKPIEEMDLKDFDELSGSF